MERAPVLAGWAVAAGVVAIFLGERVGPLRRDIYCRLPVIGHRYDDWRPKDGNGDNAKEEGEED